jgi:hypothetical protein
MGIEENNASNSIPTFIISVHYWTKNMPDSVGSVWYQAGSGIISFLQSGT